MTEGRVPEPSIDDLLRLGQIGLEQGLWADAERYYHQALTLDSENVPAMVGMARAARDPDQAQFWARRAEAIAPTDAGVAQVRVLLARQEMRDDPPVEARPASGSSSRRRLWLVASLVAVTIAVLAAVFLFDEESLLAALHVWRTQPVTTPGDMSVTTLSSMTLPPPEADGRLRAQRATALVLAPVAGTDQVSRGSGALVDGRGLVLTSLHVMEINRGVYVNAEGLALIGLSASPQQEPDAWWVGAVLAQDATADLVVLSIVADTIGPQKSRSLPEPIAWGDAQTLEPGQAIVGLGYPALGGDTLTWASGTVAGYATSLHGVAMAKTEADFLPGSSGGPVVEEGGGYVGTISTAYTDAESQGRLSYFVLEGEARNLVDRARLLPDPRSDLTWIMDEVDRIIQARR